MLTSAQANPDGHLAMPTQAADDYARTVMTWAQQDCCGTEVHKNIAYGRDRLQRYDVYVPPVGSQAQAGMPVVVFWHGGGWTNGYRDYNAFMARQLTAMRCLLVSPSYRLVGDAKLPAAFDDSLAAIAHVCQTIARYGGDPSRLYLGGHSAGGHLAALAALRPLDAARYGVPATAIKGCLPISGIMDLHHPAPNRGSLEERVYSMVLSDPLMDAVMSPICWTRGNRIPFDLSFGQADSQRVQTSNRRLAELLKLQDAPVTLSVRDGQDHFSAHTSLRDAAHPWYEALKTMIKNDDQSSRQ